MIARPPIPARPIASPPSRSYSTTTPAAIDWRVTVGYRFRFSIAGTNLAISAASLRIRSIDQSDCSLTLAGVPTVDLSALIGAEVRFVVIEMLADGTERETELFMFYFDRTTVSETISSYVVEISGSRKLTYGNPRSIALDRVLQQSSTNSSQRWRVPMRIDLKPGDTVSFESASLVISEMAYYLGHNNSYIELSDG
jgi:hypothetical protein